jgi:hypothetical protein
MSFLGKLVDLYPIEPDLGHLSFQDDVLVEKALDLSYLEYWHRVGQENGPVAEVELCDPEGRKAVLVRVDSTLGFARSRREEFSVNRPLIEVLKTTTQWEDLFDCEVSHSIFNKDRRKVLRSSLPWHEGTDWEIKIREDKLIIHGKAWGIVGKQGDLSLCSPKTQAGSTHTT